MIRRPATWLGLVALFVSLIAGCSSRQSSTSSSAPSTGANSAAVTITVDGRNQNVKGPVACDTGGGFVNIAIGEKISGADQTAYSATLTDANPPEVRSVFLGDVDGQGLSYLQGFYNNTAQATRDGKLYRISGTAGQQAKRFEMIVVCP
jgi:ipoprotein LpqH